MKTYKKIWAHFKNLPGSKGIASLHAIKGLIEAIKRKRPKKILELGAGIGTLTYTIMTSVEDFFGREYSYTFYTVENNKFCIGELEKNLKDFEGKYTMVNNTSGLLSQGIQFDLIVLDGGGQLPGDMGPTSIENMVARGGVIFIEGDRGYQREMIKNWYAGRDYILLNCRAAKRFIRWGEEQISNKGYWLYQFEPNLAQRIRFFLLYPWNRLITLRRRISTYELLK